MTEITQQKGPSSSTPTALGRWFLSKVMNHISSESRLSALREKERSSDKKSVDPMLLNIFTKSMTGIPILPFSCWQN
ncbi:hypothetical protein [Marinobacter maroccanus]|uniref:hypothetical protein n=1 Tax=Marinobacter maroccanus TaxID=2055143 RepID=UPI0018E077C9|nr:hypothetical protein [Marinobacter maroccanus]